MNRGRTFTFSLILICSLCFQPLTALAQTSVFNPGSTLNMNGGSVFGGVTFNGVGQAIASCTNAGDTLSKWTDSATNSIAGLFKSSPKGGIGSRTTTVINPDSKYGSIKPMNSSGVDPNKLQQSPNQINNKIQSVTGQTSTVPVADTATQDELKKANKRESCLKAVAYATAQNTLGQMLNHALTYVNTGFNGNPLYVRDIGSYFNSIANEETWKLINRVPTSNPIFGNALRSIVTEGAVGIQDGLISSVMDTPQARAYQSFQENFTNGGWEALLNPDNNPLDAVFNTADQLNRNITFQQQDVQNQLQRNGGLLDVKRCVEYAPSDDVAAQQQQAALTMSSTGNSNGGCLTWETVTPGSVISAQIDALTTSRVRQLEQSDQINAVLGSFFDEVLNNLYNLGLNALRGKNNGSAFTLGGLGSNTIVGSNGSPVDAAAISALGYNAANSGISSEFDVSRPQEIRAVLQAQYDYLNRAEDAKAAESRIIPVLGALDYCIPGPNASWREGLNDNISAYTGSMQVEGVEGPSKAQQTTQQIIGLIPGYGSFANGIINAAGSLFGKGTPHGLVASNVSLLDKVTNQRLTIRDSAWHENNRSPDAVYTNFQLRLKEVLDTYDKNFTLDNITNAFVSVDSANPDFAKGFVATSFDETSKLPAYDQALSEIDDNYTSSIANTKDAIAELESIRKEADTIVETAKARYIAEQKAAGTPVNESCLDQAYKLDATPITATAPRVETDTPSPYAGQMTQGAVYFYSHL